MDGQGDGDRSVKEMSATVTPAPYERPRGRGSNLQAALVFADLLDSLIVDVASESHRAARLGFDYKLNVEEEEEVRLAHQARTIVGDSGAIGTENGNKHTIDVFGQTHPTIANETFDCMNCGRPIVAGRFAPHLEKCMGKGRKARLKANRNITTTQQRRARSSPISSYGGVVSASRTPNRTPTRTPEEPQRGLTEATDGTSEESHDDDEKIAQIPGIIQLPVYAMTIAAETSDGVAGHTQRAPLSWRSKLQEVVQEGLGRTTTGIRLGFVLSFIIS